MAELPDRYPAVPQDIANYLSRRVADQQLRGVLRLAGRIDFPRLALAARLALDAEPVLGCRFVPEGAHPYWERRQDLDDEPACHLVECEDAAEALAHFLSAPLDPEREPLTLVRVLRATDGDIVAVKVSHVASDVGGLKDYLSLLTSLYRRLGDEPDYRPTTAAEVSRGQEAALRAAPGVAPRMADAQPAWGFPSSVGAQSGTRIATRRLSAEALQRIRAAGRERGATINDLFLAALLRALVATLHPALDAQLSVQMTVDLRRYLPGGKAAAVCNLSGIAHPAISAAETSTWDSTLAAVTVSTGKLKAAYPGLGVAAYLELALRGDFREMLRGLRSRPSAAATGRAHPMLTNFGVLPETCVDFGEPATADAVLYGPAASPPGFVMGLSTFRGELTCSVAYPQGQVDGGLVESVLDLVVAELLTHAS